jgi:predicted Holliday junction resolvase-like endonuclease
MTKDIKYILKVLIILIIIIVSVVIIMDILKIKSYKDYIACNKNKNDIDTIYTQKELELSKKYLVIKDSLGKNKEIENLINRK